MPEVVGMMKLVKARVDHKCDWCGEAIDKGTQYHKWACKDMGSVFPVKMHQECYEAMIDSDETEFDIGDNPRGCNCGYSAYCDRQSCIDRMDEE